MLDFNHRPTFTETLNALIDAALVAEQKTKPERDYMGASRLGVSCQRALQYEFTHTPKDEDFSGQTLRIFAAGHAFEDMAIKWLHAAGLQLFTRKQNGEAFGFSVAGGRIRGHVDGIINGAPEELGLSFPMLWECKSMNAKSWKDTVKNGVAKSKPVYAAQVAICLVVVHHADDWHGRDYFQTHDNEGGSMITLLGSLLGFISSTFPDLLKLFRDASDKKHEITLLQMQMDFQAQGHQERIEEINTQADISESEALYKTYTTGISWVDALNGTVRPVIAYSFFILYTAVKIMHFSADMPWLLWTEEDQAIFAGIISFYFGQRAMAKLRSGK